MKITVKELLQQRRAHQAASGATVSINPSLTPNSCQTSFNLHLGKARGHPLTQAPPPDRPSSAGLMSLVPNFIPVHHRKPQRTAVVCCGAQD